MAQLERIASAHTTDIDLLRGVLRFVTLCWFRHGGEQDDESPSQREQWELYEQLMHSEGEYKGDRESSDDNGREWRRCVEGSCSELFALLPAELQAHEAISVPAMVRCASRINTNSHGLLGGRSGEAYGYALLPRVAIANHSCVPNAVYCFDPADGTIALRALQPLQAGQEVFVHYTDLVAPRDERRGILQETKAFRCTCERCVTPLFPASAEALSPADAFLGGFVCPVCPRTAPLQSRVLAPSSLASGAQRPGGSATGATSTTATAAATQADDIDALMASLGLEDGEGGSGGGGGRKGKRSKKGKKGKTNQGINSNNRAVLEEKEADEAASQDPARPPEQRSTVSGAAVAETGGENGADDWVCLTCGYRCSHEAAERRQGEAKAALASLSGGCNSVAEITAAIQRFGSWMDQFVSGGAGVVGLSTDNGSGSGGKAKGSQQQAQSGGASPPPLLCPEHAFMLNAMFPLARLLRAVQEHSTLVKVSRHALAISKASTPPNFPETAEAMGLVSDTIGLFLDARGQRLPPKMLEGLRRERETLAAHAYAACQVSLGEANDLTQACLTRLREVRDDV